MQSQIRISPRRRLSFERRILLLALGAGLPGSLLSIVLLAAGNYSTQTRWTLGVIVVLFWISFACAVRQKIRFPLQTLANLLSGIREGDFSTRARGARNDDALGEVITEVNTLGETLSQQRFGALEATALLRAVMSEIDVAVFAFDHEQRLRLVNRAGERLLARPYEQLLDRTAQELGLADCLQGESARTVQMMTASSLGRWGMRRTRFRQGGLPHQLLVLTDLSKALREEEREAWQRLVRVLGHELNNSLTPIKSIAGSLESLLTRKPLPEDWEQDMKRGLEVIATRAESLSRVMEGYARLARMPSPRRLPVTVGEWLRHAATLETRVPVSIEAGPELTVEGDRDQLDQLLINLVRNAADASLETGGRIEIAFKKLGKHLEVSIKDEGPGLSNTANLFVPFFTTKPKGSGIGLVLSRQIAEAHGGSLVLENRKEARGCQAVLRLPLMGERQVRSE